MFVLEANRPLKVPQLTDKYKIFFHPSEHGFYFLWDGENLNPERIYTWSTFWVYGYSLQFCIPCIEPDIWKASDFIFIHGNIDDLLAGKVCVVRNQPTYVQLFSEKCKLLYSSEDKVIREYEGDVWKIVKNCPYKSVRIKEGVIVIVGTTVSGNTKVVLKPHRSK